MITLIVVKNPFAPYKGREIHKIKYKPDKTLLVYTKPYLFDNIDVDNMVFAVKGKLVNPDSKINDGDFIVMSPSIGKGGGKNPLLVVATIALSVAAMSLGAGFAGVSALSQATGWAAIGGYAVAAGVMYLGGTLINHAFGTAKKESTSNPTYSWDGITTTSGQGNPIPLTYGTVKSGGQTLSKFITISNDDQYLYWLISAGEGPLSFSDIEMNSNPIGYYKDTSYDIRNGTFNQSAISNFNDTVSTLELDQELLTDSYRQYDIDGNANQGLMIQVECSNGLYYVNDNGSLGTEWVSIKADYCITGSNNWITFVNESISAAQTSAVRKQYRVDGIAAGTYTVRVICTGRGADIGSTRAQTRIWWTAVSGITYDDFCYPGIGLIGIKVLATDQLSGSPAVTFLKTRSTVLVYNPDKSAYEQQDATNPAWASYDAVHRAVDLYGDGSAVVVDGAPAELMMYDKFSAWAASCTAKNLHVNIEVNTADEMLTVINKNIACVGYGRVQLFGVKYGCTFDDVVDTPVQMFTMGNIIQGSFQEEFLQTSDRANAVEITFTNKDKNYERDTTTVYSDDYDEADQYNTVTSITMDGITSYEQAYAYGKYQLYCNKWLVRTCIFNASIDAIACNVGDVVALSHDVPEWACSGRITAVSGNTITMNGIFDNYDSTAAYQFQYRASDTDSLYTVEVLSIIILSDGVQAVLASLGTDAPSIGDICDIAKVNIGSKWFTIKAITRSNNGEFERQITALEYNANVFNQNYTIPPQNYSTAQANQAQNVIKFSGNQIQWTDASGFKHARMYLSWALPDNAYATKFIIYISTDGVNYTKLIDINGFEYQFSPEIETLYYIKIITILNLSQSSGAVIRVAAGVDVLPPNVTELDCEVTASGTRRYYWTFTYPDPNDIAGFRLKYTQGVTLNWNMATAMHDGLITQQPFEALTVRSGAQTVMIKAVDNAGNESENFAYCEVDLGDPIEENVLFKDVLGSQNNWSKFSITGGFINLNGNIGQNSSNAFWLKNGLMWQSSDTSFWQGVLAEFTAITQFEAPASGNFWLICDATGPFSILWRAFGENNFWITAGTDFWGSSADVFWDTSGNILKPYSGKSQISAGNTIQIEVAANANVSEETIIQGITGIIDVPDRVEHFSELSVPIIGLQLDIQTPNYVTTSVHVNSIEGVTSDAYIQPIIVSRNPCKIKLVDSSGNPISAIVDLTWQGYEKEVS
ncbi:phage tail protein [Pectinatus frisingensis]|uniref:TipJ family phage tail tip protein n=1 Tax=Pectinatus frisingensis TaxID=865 RepID=UPI0018C67FB7|nr:phage tail protein [Pectinatus frisingensis]